MRKRQNPVACIVCGKIDSVSAYGRDNAPLFFRCTECGMNLHFSADENGSYPSAEEQIERYKRASKRGKED